jgi:hypothetical protein
MGEAREEATDPNQWALVLHNIQTLTENIIISKTAAKMT